MLLLFHIPLPLPHLQAGMILIQEMGEWNMLPVYSIFFLHWTSQPWRPCAVSASHPKAKSPCIHLSAPCPPYCPRSNFGTLYIYIIIIFQVHWIIIGRSENISKPEELAGIHLNRKTDCRASNEVNPLSKKLFHQRSSHWSWWSHKCVRVTQQIIDLVSIKQ